MPSYIPGNSAMDLMKRGGGGTDIEAILRARSESQNFTGFMPDKGVYDQSVQAAIDQALGRLPMGVENFNADLASRGLYTAGEAPKYLYSDVYAPVAQGIAQATAQGNLAFAGAQQQGAIATENAMSNRMGMYVNWLISQSQLELQRKQISAQQSAGWGSALGSAAGIAAMALL